jgi:acyl-CoA oxidase
MLMRYVNVDKEGQLNMQGNPKVLYSVMMYTRLQLLTQSMNNLTRALTVGIRYGIVRTQFRNYKDPTTGKLVERKIIDYQTHLNRICPLLAFNFAQVIGGHHMYA